MYIFLTCPSKILVNLSAILTLVVSCKVEGVWAWVMCFNWERVSVSFREIGVNLKWVPSSRLLIVRSSLSSDAADRANQETSIQRTEYYTHINIVPSSVWGFPFNLLFILWFSLSCACRVSVAADMRSWSTGHFGGLMSTSHVCRGIKPGSKTLTDPWSKVGCSA